MTFSQLEIGQYFKFDYHDMAIPMYMCNRVWLKIMPCKNPHNENLDANAHCTAFQSPIPNKNWIWSNATYQVIPLD